MRKGEKQTVGRKTFVYSDELNDDFARSNGKIKKKKIDAEYKYVTKNPVWKAGAFVVYRLLATPIGYLSMKFGYGLRIENRKAIKKFTDEKTGFFLYGNHTQGWGDAFSPTLACFPHKVHVVVNADAVSIPVVGSVAHMVGGMPLPSDIGGMKNFLSAMKKFTDCGNVVAIYPEAHIWPYYNGIREFSDASFAYPLKFKKPVVAFVVTYRKRKVMKSRKPYITVTLSDPFYPENYKNKTELRNAVYAFMAETVEKQKSYGYNTYIKENKVENNDSM